MNAFKQAGMACAGIFIVGIGTVAFAAVTSAPEQPNASYGAIHFGSDERPDECTLRIPEKSETFNFSHADSGCEDDKMTTFWLENVPSATLIYFYAKGTCSNAPIADNFYMKIKTVKQPTDWQVQPPTPPVTQSFDELQTAETGDMIPKKYIRMESKYIGNNFKGDNKLGEELSCVYIERSQPVTP